MANSLRKLPALARLYISGRDVRYWVGAVSNGSAVCRDSANLPNGIELKGGGSSCGRNPLPRRSLSVGKTLNVGEGLGTQTARRQARNDDSGRRQRIRSSSLGPQRLLSLGQDNPRVPTQ